jgi:ribonuclease Z
MGLQPGPWLNELKTFVLNDISDGAVVQARCLAGGVETTRELPLGLLRSNLVVQSKGAKFGYVVDTLFSRENFDKICELVRDADLFFCESLFLDKDRDEAARRHHLTARQAGTLAREAGVKKLVTFHFSPRYNGEEHLLYAEAQAAFHGEIPSDRPN